MNKSFFLLLVYYFSSMGCAFFAMLYGLKDNPYFLLNSIVLGSIHCLFYLSYLSPQFSDGDYICFKLKGNKKLGNFSTIVSKHNFYYIIKAQTGSFHKLLIHKQFLWQKMNKDLKIEELKTNLFFPNSNLNQ